VRQFADARPLSARGRPEKLSSCEISLSLLTDGYQAKGIRIFLISNRSSFADATAEPKGPQVPVIKSVLVVAWRDSFCICIPPRRPDDTRALFFARIVLFGQPEQRGQYRTVGAQQAIHAIFSPGQLGVIEIVRCMDTRLRRRRSGEKFL